MSRIVVVGSLNMDFVVQVDRLPGPGETVLGGHFQTLPGGKGANQAYAVGRLSQHPNSTLMIGRVGQDVFGNQLKASLTAASVDVTLVTPTTQSTGVAMISVEKSGQNCIVVASGANLELRPSDLESVSAAFEGASHALFQLETPLETVHTGLRLARQKGVRTILDPAPGRLLPGELLELVDIITPNETEASQLLGRPSADPAREILALGPKAVLLKLGAEGCRYLDIDTWFSAPGFVVEAVDTTAAGDTFNAALAVALAEGSRMEHAMRFANAAAALSVTKPGAQASIPTRAEVDQFLSAR